MSGKVCLEYPDSREGLGRRYTGFVESKATVFGGCLSAFGQRRRPPEPDAALLADPQKEAAFGRVVFDLLLAGKGNPPA